MMTQTRRLAAVLAADVRAATEDAVKSQHAAMREALARFQGRLVDHPGDGLIAEFASIVDAVECAVFIHRSLAERGAERPREERLELRIGVSLGDVLIDGERRSGDTIIVAARLAELVESGGTAISGTAHDQVATKLRYRWETLEAHSIARIQQPVVVYRMVDAELARSAGRHDQARATPMLRHVHGVHRPSIAVLPFREYDLRGERSYFADGIVEDIIGALASLPDLFVISHSSTLAFRGVDVDVRAAGERLGVRYVVSGGVRRAGERIRTVAELCEAETGGILWTERVEGSTAEVFALQDRLAERIVTTLAPHVRQAELQRALRKHPESLDAYDFVLRGLDLLYRLRREEFEQAYDMFQRAIELEPGYATPYALSANWYSIRIGQGWSGNLAEDVEAVNRLATAALQRDPFDTRALALCGHVRSFLLRDYDGAIVLFQRALTGSPNSAEAWLWSSPTYSYIGEGAEAVRRAEQSLRLSPFDSHVFLNHTALALAHYTAGDLDSAVTAGRRAITENPRYTAALRIFAASLAAAGRIAEARSVSRTLLEYDTAFGVEAFCRTHPYKDAGRREMLARHLRSAGLPG
jgi:TolB-like protein/class 3 adenylate cyclase/Tfp pilus assembly protein PilF